MLHAYRWYGPQTQNGLSLLNTFYFFLCWSILPYSSINLSLNTCDVIKQNELQLANTVFKIQPNKADSFFCSLLFVQSVNCLYLWNQLPNLCGVFTKLKPKQYPNRNCQKTKNHIYRHQTHFVWSHNICDMIKGNESDAGNFDFELQAKRGDKFLCFTLFLKLKNCSYLRNHMSDWDGIWIKM